jgi:hypothetical protein
MTIPLRDSRRVLVVVLAIAPLLAGCRVTVSDDREGPGEAVDIQSPIGDLSVRTDVPSPDTGLAVYPGAQPLREGKEDESADVTIDSPLFGLRVVAATFESEASPAAVVAHYRREMAAYGPVTECRGELDFRGREGSRRPVCQEHARASEIQLVAGTEERHRLVVVKPRGTGSEISVVRIQTDDRS